MNRSVALLGNPNVGKSTVFNRLTGLRQHTGNWPGKTVAVARGAFSRRGVSYDIVDLPGAYSLSARTPEEAVARDAVLAGEFDALIVVCDATCLERSLPLAFQALEWTGNVLVLVNLVDEAEKKSLRIDADALKRALGVPVAAVSARTGRGMEAMLDQLEETTRARRAPVAGTYAPAVERAMARCMAEGAPSRFAALERAIASDEALGESVSASLYLRAEQIAREATRGEDTSRAWQTRADRLLTGGATGYLTMGLMLALVFYLTISFSAKPSAWLSANLFALEGRLSGALSAAGCPPWLEQALLQGVYRVTAWVVAVMLPPMAIFFPLFTLLEDLGYLPRVAFGLDGCFRACRACGKQALTMMMGFGCNAVGVTGCRIIDSPRERLIAILTNAMVPCNGRFPLLILLVTLYASAGGAAGAAAWLTALVCVGVCFTLLCSRLLSDTLLRGLPSSFALEMPPFRRPQWGRVLVRSALDRTLFVLGRALSVAAPAGLILWLLCGIRPDGVSLAARMALALDPAGRLLGMDGVMLTAFVLGLPANELVLPVALMLYRSGTALAETGVAAEVGAILAANGWTLRTAVCAMVFTLFHWPCSTTLLTVRRETGAWKWTAAAFILPTLTGALLCALIAALWR